ncbi:MAG: hypothetical protein FWB96_09735 [Defluviitaleaceae bacterium]|nr:hypothetical protein [Defluviitaleaceae bacterium]MCL2263104.1 hypothetical protein [Defluviitaleaceae bacterium]
MDKELFDDLMTACNDAVEYERGNLQLNTRTVTISDDELAEFRQLFRNFELLPQHNRAKVIQYVNELAAIG